MNANPTISIITVCRDRASTLERALRSVFEQNWPKIEHIVIDGASTDGTVEILDRFRQKLSYVISEPDDGIYDAMNKGLKQANGDIICFLNADDFYADSAVLSRVVTQMQSQNLDALMGDVGFFHKTKPEGTVRRYRSGRFRPKRLAWGWAPAHPGLFLSKTVTDRVGHFKTDYAIAGDYEFIIRVFHGHKLRYQHFPEVVVKMQMGGVSTGSFRAKILLNKEILRACRENGIQTNMFKILSKYPAKILEQWVIP